MIDQSRFKKLWNAIISESITDTERAKKSPLSIGNGISDQLKSYLLENVGSDGDCIAKHAHQVLDGEE